MNEESLRDAIDYAAQVLKTAKAGSLADAATKAHDILYEGLIVHYAAKSPAVFAYPMGEDK